MAQYHALISGLPSISLEMPKAPYTQEEFYAELSDILSSGDRKYLDWLRLEEANKELIILYHSGAFNPTGEELEVMEEDEAADTSLPINELKLVAHQASIGKPIRRNELLPGYMLHFINERYLKTDEDEEVLDNTEPTLSPLSDEDRLAQLYFVSGANNKNAFVANWFSFNQTLRNVLALYTCRKLGWNPEKYIVGNSEIEEQLLTSKSKDFGLSEEYPEILTMISIAEEQDIARREKMIDALRWQWLDEQTEWSVFDIENVLCYYLKLGIIERWSNLNEEKGNAIFREIVLGLKQESNHSLQEFKAKNKHS